jgi:hypothetical protein
MASRSLWRFLSSKHLKKIVSSPPSEEGEDTRTRTGLGRDELGETDQLTDIRFVAVRTAEERKASSNMASVVCLGGRKRSTNEERALGDRGAGLRPNPDTNR